MVVIKLDGTRVELQPVDLDGDGITGGVERISMSAGQKEVIQPTELGETLRELNLDVIEDHTRMSSIDMKSRLHWAEVNHILAIDALVAFRVLPTRCLSFTRQKKRLNVSIEGKGREEMVDVVAGKREMDKQSVQLGMGDKVKGLFGIGGQK